MINGLLTHKLLLMRVKVFLSDRLQILWVAKEALRLSCARRSADVKGLFGCGQQCVTGWRKLLRSLSIGISEGPYKRFRGFELSTKPFTPALSEDVIGINLLIGSVIQGL